MINLPPRNALAARLSYQAIENAMIATNIHAVDSSRRLVRDRVNFVWLNRLRWSAIAGQLLTVAITQWGLGIDIPWKLLLAIIGCETLSNLAVGFALRKREVRERAGERLLGFVMAMDLMFLTALLFCSGGPSNPFSVFYIINISLSAAILPSRWAWGLTILAVASFGLLFWNHMPVAALSHDAHAAAHDHHIHGMTENGTQSVDSMSLHLRGMLLAFAGAAGFVAYFVTRVRRELSLREAELATAERRQAQAEKLESLVTLAAGAAHELATPLATVMVLAREIEVQMEARCMDHEMLEEVRVIGREVGRCREILSLLTSQAGERIGESWSCCPLGGLLGEARAATTSPHHIALSLEPALEQVKLYVPRRALVQTFQALLQNAIEASEVKSAVHVQVQASIRGAAVEVVISDLGCGMSAQVLRRIGEPFFTTRPSGQGMGLGVFLAKRVVEQLGGQVKYQSRPGEGTSVVVTLPSESRCISSTGEQPKHGDQPHALSFSA